MHAACNIISQASELAVYRRLGDMDRRALYMDCDVQEGDKWYALLVVSRLLSTQRLIESVND